jgi:hypothetical protein
MSQTAPTTSSPEGSTARKSGFENRDEYLKFLEANKIKKGKAWYDQKVREMAQREETWRKKSMEDKRLRDNAWALWRARISAWSSAGGFDQVVRTLLGEGKKATSDRWNFYPGGVKFEVSYRGRTCCRWDGKTFANGKKGSREAYGVAKCIFELTGSSNPSRDAREILIKLSGIQPDDIAITPQVEEKLAKMRKEAEIEAQRRKEAELREDPLSPEKEEEVPRRIIDPAAIEELTLLMAQERSFPVDYAKRLVAEGTIWFGAFRFRGEDGKVVDTGRAIAVSDVHGFRTGTLVGHAGREFRKFFPHEQGKGKNIGAVAKGAVFIGNWSEKTKKITIIEGVYDAAALRLLRERRGHPLQDDECFVIMTGSRMPQVLLQICQERGIEILAALDNDKTGRELVRDTAAWCNENKVSFKPALPSRGEMTIGFPDDEWGRKCYLDLASKLSASECRFGFLAKSDGRLSLVAETSDQTVDIYSALHKAALEERVSRKQATPSAAKNNASDEPKLLSIKWHRKDWNELLQREYKCRALTTVGLPPAAPAHEKALVEYLSSCNASPDQIEKLRASLLVYPALVDGVPVAVWSMIDSETGSAVGFHAFPLLPNRGKNIAAGATWQAGPSLGNPETSSILAVADNPECAMRSWSSGVLTVIRQDEEFPKTALTAAQKAAMAVMPAFAETDDMLEREALLARWARENDLGYRAPLKPAPAPSISR